MRLCPGTYAGPKRGGVFSARYPCTARPRVLWHAKDSKRGRNSATSVLQRHTLRNRDTLAVVMVSASGKHGGNGQS